MGHRAVPTGIATLVVLAIVVVLVGGAVLFVVDATSPGQRLAPDATFDADWDAETRTLTITHDGGEAFTAENTRRLEVIVRDDDGTGPNSYFAARSDWANDSNGRFPVGIGDTFVVTGEGGDGDLDVERAGTNARNAASERHEPAVGDEVTILWYGAEAGPRSIWTYTIADAPF